jgi:hypothetical protein
MRIYYLFLPENLGTEVFVSYYIYNCPTVLNPSSRIYNYATLELVLFNTGVYCSLRWSRFYICGCIDSLVQIPVCMVELGELTASDGNWRQLKSG